MFEFAIPSGSVHRSPRPVVASVIAHGLALLLLLTLRFSAGPSTVLAPLEHLTLLARTAETPVRPLKPRLLHHERYRPVPPAPKTVEFSAVPVIPAPSLEIAKAVLPDLPVLPAAPATIKPSGFNDAKPAAPVSAPKVVIKASGFESPESSASGPARGTLAAVGGFDSASPARAGAPQRSATATRPSGFSDASAAGGGNLRSAAPINSGTFGDSAVDLSARHTVATQAAAFTSVEILSKPKPTYTDEARAKKIEGEVLLEIEFLASGLAKVLRVVRGLGYGLDESALTAARGIHFRPATRNSAAVDTTAVVHIIFQLAN